MKDPLTPTYIMREKLRRRKQAELDLELEEQARKGRERKGWWKSLNSCLGQVLSWVLLLVLGGVLFPFVKEPLGNWLREVIMDARPNVHKPYGVPQAPPTAPVPHSTGWQRLPAGSGGEDRPPPRR